MRVSRNRLDLVGAIWGNLGVWARSAVSGRVSRNCLDLALPFLGVSVHCRARCAFYPPSRASHATFSRPYCKCWRNSAALERHTPPVAQATTAVLLRCCAGAGHVARSHPRGSIHPPSCARILFLEYENYRGLWGGSKKHDFLKVAPL